MTFWYRLAQHTFGAVTWQMRHAVPLGKRLFSSLRSHQLRTVAVRVSITLLSPLIVADAGIVRAQETAIHSSDFQSDGLRRQSQPSRESARSQPAASGQPWLVLSLRDVIELAMQDSNIVRVLNGRVRLSSESVYDVMIANWEAAARDGVFQPSISANVDGSQINEPPNAFFGPGISARTKRDTLDFNLRLKQPLRTGGELTMGIEPPLAYLYFPEGVDPDEFNPSWSAGYVFRFRQPLMRGKGREVATAPIQVARLRASQSQWKYQEELNSLIRSVTQAYWNLYAAWVEQQALNAVIPLAAESVRIEKLRYEAEQSIYADVARAEYQLEDLRVDAIRAQAKVRRSTLQLRQLIGGPAQLSPQIFPGDAPNEEAPIDDAQFFVQTALRQRPQLNQQRDIVRQRGVELQVAKNNTLPKVDFRADYRSGGLSESLDKSLQQAGDFDYTDWAVGLNLDVPLGNKTATSRQRATEVRLTRDHMQLQRLEQNVAFEIIELHSDLTLAWQRFEISKRQAAQTQEWLRLSRIRYSEPPAAGNERNWLLLELADFQRAMTSWVDAVTSSGSAIAEYSTLQARLDEASGTAVSKWTTSQSSRDAIAVTPLVRMPGSYRYGHSMLPKQIVREIPTSGIRSSGSARYGGYATRP